MSDWKIEVRKVKAEDVTTHALLVDFLESTRAWKRISKDARDAVAAAYPDGVVDAHPNTMRALWRHGFVVSGNWHEAIVLTEAGKAAAKWCVKR